MKIIEIISHYKSTDNLSRLLENRKKYHPDTYFIIVDNSNTFKPPKNFNGIILDGIQNHIKGLTTSDYHYLGTSQGLNYLRYVIREDLWNRFEYDYVLTSQQDIYFEQSISSLPNHEFLSVKHYDEHWHYVNADMFYGINWHNFNTMDLDMVNSYLGIVDGRIPIKDLNTISLQTDIIIDDNNKDVEQTFTYDDKLICRNEMELLHNGICLKVNSEVS
jgi:hypothetical protein